MKNRSLILAALCLGLMSAVPTQAKAASCKPLLNSFVTYLKGNGNIISYIHTTNYQANGFWGTANSWGADLTPATGGPILSGTVNRTWHHDGSTQDFSIEFYANGSVRFAGQYGPYPTTCYGNKFLIVNTGDSFETFTFTKGYLG